MRESKNHKKTSGEIIGLPF